MNPIRRYEKIMEVLLTQKEVTVAQLSESLGVTGKTIREDLAKLEEQGLLVRVHGGAVLAQSDQYGILPSKEPLTKHADEKKGIALLALHHIQEGDIIALDGGSTTLEIARRLENRPLTVITNDVYIISELAAKDQIRLVVPGGYRVRNMLAGPDVVAATYDTFLQSASLPFAERFLAAMEAGEAAGGDKRGKQSACLLIHTTEDYPALSIRADDHPDPLAELRRLYRISQGRYAAFMQFLATRDNLSGVYDRAVIEAEAQRREAALRDEASAGKEPA